MSDTNPLEQTPPPEEGPKSQPKRAKATKPPAKRGRGRPTALEDPEMAPRLWRVVKYLGQGAHRQPACQTAKVPWTTFRDVLRRGKSKEAKYELERKFRHAVLVAEGEAETKVAAAAHKMALKNPKVVMAYLAVRWRKRWNPRQQVEMTGKDGGPLQMKAQVEELPPDLSVLSTEELRLYKAVQEKVTAAAKAKAEKKKPAGED